MCQRLNETMIFLIELIPGFVILTCHLLNINIRVPLVSDQNKERICPSRSSPLVDTLPVRFNCHSSSLNFLLCISHKINRVAN